MSILYILSALLLLAILIVVHEQGHFWAARWMKIDVREFAVGFGPKLLGWKSRKYETTFAVRAIPLGGYCSFYGEDDVEGAEKEDPRAFPKQNVWKRLFVILMGPMMNFVLAFVLATGFYWAGGIPTATGVDPFIQSVNGAGPAYDAGLKDGDVILEINGKNMLDGTMETLLNAISDYREGEPAMQITVARGGETLHLEMTPAWNPEENRMMVGVTISGRYRVVTEKTTLIGAAGGYLLRRNRWLVPIPAVLSNTLIIPFVLKYGYMIEDIPLPWMAIYIFAGEIVGCYILGELLAAPLLRHRNTVFPSE